MERLTIECTEKILDNVTLEQLEPLLDVFSTKSSTVRAQASELRYDRLNPRRIFNKLVEDTEKLMKVMRIYNVVLSGSRAVEYFVPGSAACHSDWDFYCPDYKLDVIHSSRAINGFESYMKHIGTQWESEEVGPDIYHIPCISRIKKGIITEGKYSGNKIQLMYVDHDSILNCILNFHSTIPQCFISGFAAVHMYSSLVCRHEYVEWMSNNQKKRETQLHIARDNCLACQAVRHILDNYNISREYIGEIEDKVRSKYGTNTLDYHTILLDTEINGILLSLRIAGHSAQRDIINALIILILNSHTCNPDDTDVKALRKYVSRGYEKVELQHYRNVTANWQSYSEWFFRIRSIDDADSMIVSFSEYAGNEEDRVSIEERVSRLKEFRWYEYPYGTVHISDVWKVEKASSLKRGEYISTRCGGI